MRRAKRRVVVAKRDGTLECFSLPKLRSCLVKGLRACACDAGPANPLAQAVGGYLRGSDSGNLPSTEYVYHCVCAALSQTGLEEVACTLAAHRRLRAARRRRVWVFGEAPGDRGAVRWRKGALVATLQGIYDLRYSVARFLAGQIEQQVFALGYRLVSKTFLAELTRNEVLAWGLLELPVEAAQDNSACDGPAAARQPKEEI